MRPIHEQMQTARIVAGIQEHDAARRIGIDVKYLKRIEDGLREPPLAGLRRLARLYQCTFTITGSDDDD
jgi:transcriptional regulator with XRE-family HTH domain